MLEAVSHLPCSSGSVVLAFLFFSVFVLHALITRVGKKEAPLRLLGRNHLYFGMLYAVVSLFLSVTWAERLIGFYCYFSFQYPFFFVLFGQISRGFSLNICVSALLAEGRVSEEKIYRSYGDGKGIEYVKSDRLKVMLESKVVQDGLDGYRLTTKGTLIVFFNRILLRAFAMDYLGRVRGGERS